MSIEHMVYNKMKEMKEMKPSDIYIQLIKEYPVNIVDFVMDDEFGYIHTDAEERKKRDDKHFKKDVKKRYNNRCIISGVSVTSQVCHIKPLNICDDNEKYDVNNGILLRDDLHTLFDRHDIIIDPETHTVKVSDSIMNSDYDKCYHQFNGVVLKINDMSKRYLELKYNNL